MKKLFLTALAFLSLSANSLDFLIHINDFKPNTNQIDSSLNFPIYMPRYKYNTTMTFVAPWLYVTSTTIDKKEGISQEWSRNNKTIYHVGFTKCGENLSPRPFWIKDVQKNRIYIDNSPLDGVIDEIIESPRISLSKKAPKCE